MGIVARQSFKAALSNYAGILLGFLNLFILFPLFFVPRDLGALRLLLETGAVLSSFALLGTHYSINRFFPYFRTDDRKHTPPHPTSRFRRRTAPVPPAPRRQPTRLPHPRRCFLPRLALPILPPTFPARTLQNLRPRFRTRLRQPTILLGPALLQARLHTVRSITY